MELVKLITAIASVPTAFLLIRLAPLVVAIPSPEQLHIANRELERANRRTQSGGRADPPAERRTREACRRAHAALLEANVRLQESEKRVQDILDTAPTLVYMKDPEGRF